MPIGVFMQASGTIAWGVALIATPFVVQPSPEGSGFREATLARGQLANNL